MTTLCVCPDLMKPVRYVFAFCALMLAAGVSNAANGAELYENLDVYGVLECEVRGDIRLAVSEEKKLRCDFFADPRHDVMRRFHGRVSKLDVLGAFEAGDRIAWTVLYLKRDDEVMDEKLSLTGRYARAWKKITDEYELKPNTLVGGEANTFALEPRPIEGQESRNIARNILYLELTQ